jgi:hypothetical protein
MQLHDSKGGQLHITGKQKPLKTIYEHTEALKASIVTERISCRLQYRHAVYLLVQVQVLTWQGRCPR